MQPEVDPPLAVEAGDQRVVARADRDAAVAGFPGGATAVAARHLGVVELAAIKRPPLLQIEPVEDHPRPTGPVLAVVEDRQAAAAVDSRVVLAA